MEYRRARVLRERGYMNLSRANQRRAAGEAQHRWPLEADSPFVKRERSYL